ncbi:MAG: hypothetical protein F9K32_04530 [Desulfobulbaceae bacterium]|nr:MAG: hypothetical protein F9K32_04530 [Desulfobulbaceae bacterium]
MVETIDLRTSAKGISAALIQQWNGACECLPCHRQSAAICCQEVIKRFLGRLKDGDGMGIEHGEVPHDWNYFFCIEDDVTKLSRWIEFAEDNETVYSIELARLLMTASAEADVVAKDLCKIIKPGTRASRINEYRPVLLEKYPDLHGAEVAIPRFGKILHPWSNWRDAVDPPLWWTANNKIKHHRKDHFKEANLKNVLNAVAGLLILLVLRTSKDRPSLYPGPTVFEPRTFAYRDGSGVVFR